MSLETKKRWKAKVYSFVLLTMLLFSMTAFLVYTQAPEPHNVEGRVFTNASNGVQNGIPVTINDTNSGDFVKVFVDAPPSAQHRGSYSATVEGFDGDFIIVRSWNSTHYGENTSTLDPQTTTVNVGINTSRDSEANVTILQPQNHSLRNKSIPFNVSANVTILGADGVGCNATIEFSDQNVLNVSAGENLTKVLGNIPFESTVRVNWSVTGTQNGTSNITVFALCASDDVNLEKSDRKTVFNVTIQNLIPVIGNLTVDTPVDLAAGGNASVFCNASITDSNLASDISLVNATFFQESVGGNAADDNNDHYTNSSCTNVSSSRFDINYSCGFSVAYYANNGTWKCNVTVTDGSNATSFRNGTSVINELVAIDINPSIIDYGSLRATNVSGDVNATVRNFGNVPFNVTLRGFAPNESLAYLNNSMACEKGNISNDEQRFSLFNGTDFSLMSRMRNESQQISGLTLPQRVNDAAFGSDANTTFWKLRIPSLVVGRCNGTVIFGTVPT